MSMAREQCRGGGGRAGPDQAFPPDDGVEYTFKVLRHKQVSMRFARVLGGAGVVGEAEVVAQGERESRRGISGLGR